MEKRSARLAVTVILLFALTFISSFAFASAVSSSAKIADVGYILVNKRNPNQDILNVFASLNLTYNLIEDKNVLRYYSNGSLARFRLLFVDDMRLNNARKIPLSNFPSVIMNSYYGKDWGLTDNEGISQLTSNVPLSVRMIDDGILQVYTMAQASMVGSFIPYFYIDDLNKANMTSVARTWVSDPKYNSNNDFGDVISYVANGTRLANNRVSSGKMCFFGIAKTKYWTNDAKQMFYDCVGYVGTVCSSDSDCGGNSIGDKSCNGASGKDVYQNASRMRCIYPGTAKSECVADSTPQFVETCAYGCADGACLPQCTTNPLNLSNCGSGSYSSNFCIGNNVTRTHQMPTCSLLGTCGFDSINETVSVCAYGCLNGECLPRCSRNLDCDDSNNRTEDICLNPGTMNSSCVNRPIVCSFKSDCGVDGYVGNPFCSLNGSYQNYTAFTCNNAGTSNSSCSNITTTNLLQQCSGSCTNGVCVECLKDSDCGIDFFSNKFCNGPLGKDVFRNFTDYSCSNYQCVENTIKILNETCSDICLDGSCRDITCSSNSDCDDHSLYTLDECANPGTIQSFCSHTPINCVSNLDCGTTGFLGNEYCMTSDVFKNYQNATCLNNGTPNSYCIVTQTQTSLNDCGVGAFGNYSGNFCKSGDVYHSRSFFERGCTISQGGLAACYSNQTSPTDSRVEICAYGCDNGVCLPQCSNNPQDLSRCVNESFSANFCISNNVTRYHVAPTCSLQGTCGMTNITETVESCGYQCSNGACVDDVRVHDVGIVTPIANGTNGIRIIDGVGNPILDAIAKLKFNSSYRIEFNIVNKGNFTENVSLAGTSGCSGISFSGESNNFLPGAVVSKPYSNKKPICALGLYTLLVNETLLTAVDSNPSDNTATRQFRVVECFNNGDCGSLSSSLVCKDGDSYNNTITPTCSIEGVCSNTNSSVKVNDCAHGCDSSTGTCLPECTQNSDCNDSLFCNGAEVCSDNHCVNAPANISCSAFNLPAIARCDNVPDSNPFTWDTAPGFTSQCNEGLKGCTTSSYSFLHNLILGKCGVVCLGNIDCSNLTNNHCEGNTAVHEVGICEGSYSCGVNRTSENCVGGCSNGECIVTCSNNASCGTNGFVGSAVCTSSVAGSNVIRSFVEYTCNNPNTPQAFCSNATIQRTISNCLFGCASGKCLACVDGGLLS